MKVTVNCTASVQSQSPMSITEMALAVAHFSGQSFSPDVEPTMTVAQLKALINGLLQIDSALNVSETLLEKDVMLGDNNTLEQADVQDGDVLTLKIIIQYN